MSMYEIVKAKSQEEALAQSKFQVGQPVVIAQAVASGNSDGTYTVRVTKVEKL